VIFFSELISIEEISGQNDFLKIRGNGIMVSRGTYSGWIE